MIDCGNWAVSATWAVPARAASGSTSLELARTDNGGASHIVFIVRDDSSHSDLFFQTSDTTWQAYNQYGGNSLYVGGPGTNPGRAYKVSYNRPFTTRDTAPEDWVFNAEYPMVRWLEANGYDVSYATGVDSDRSGARILQHKVIPVRGHDEYWSGAAADQRRGCTSRRRSPGVLQRQRGLLEDALGEQHFLASDVVSHARQLQRNAREREDRSGRYEHVDWHVGRSADSVRQPMAADRRMP